MTTTRSRPDDQGRLPSKEEVFRRAARTFVNMTPPRPKEDDTPAATPVDEREAS